MYDSRKCEEIIEWIIVTGYVCSKCDKLYLIQEQLRLIKDEYGDDINLREVVDSALASVKTSAVEQIKEPELNNTSALAQLGYSST